MTCPGCTCSGKAACPSSYFNSLSWLWHGQALSEDDLGCYVFCVCGCDSKIHLCVCAVADGCGCEGRALSVLTRAEPSLVVDLTSFSDLVLLLQHRKQLCSHCCFAIAALLVCTSSNQGAPWAYMPGLSALWTQGLQYCLYHSSLSSCQCSTAYLATNSSVSSILCNMNIHA